MVVGRGDGNAFVGLKFSIVVKWGVGEGADIRTSRKNERGSPSRSFKNLVVEKLGAESGKNLALVGNGDLLNGTAANRFVSRGNDLNPAAPEEDGVTGIVCNVVHRDDMVECLADGDERGAIEWHIPRFVDEQGFT